MTKTFTAEELLYVAQTVEPRPDEEEWFVFECPVSGGMVALHDLSIGYNPLHDKAQQLRIRDFLAGKGVVIFLDGQPTAYRMGADGMLEHHMRPPNDPLFHILASNKSINHCAIQAVLAIKEG